MKTLTILFTALSLFIFSSCCSEDDPDRDESLTGSICYHYDGVDSDIYVNGSLIDYYTSSGLSFVKINKTHVRLFSGIRYSSDILNSYRLEINDIEVFGRPYDVYFNYNSEAENNRFIYNERSFPIASVKIEGSLYSSWAESAYTPPVLTRDDGSAPDYTGDVTITVLLKDGEEYVFKITRLSHQ